MKVVTNKILVALVASGFMVSAANSLADSSYGYSAAAAGVSAQAQVKIKVTVPELVVLRVGADSAVDTVDLTAKAMVNTAPGLISADGNNVGVGADATTAWDKNIPTFSVTSQSLDAAAWTNAQNVFLTCTSDTGLSTLNLDSSKVKVASTGTLTHPGAATDCPSASKTSIPKNTLMTATWAYSIDAADLANAAAGNATQTTTYTAANI